jgi:hypothetical protein
MSKDPIQFEEKEQKNLHEKGTATFAKIFANEIAVPQINLDKPVFEPGSIIVREKLLKRTDEIPELVTVMIKREKGFSPKSNDWEFFVVSSKVENVIDREKAGSCSKCHTQARGGDFVFKIFNK